ncbi:winged helix-turn-helix domain-containing protein [Marinivivus vitaminiproducens]|uniref:winged helix-turn-helix domain-containing protein n=1 Tax=Marinivivus vitaminiproducens TaxID=3035935 RepID=UPI0027A43F3F|nr:winged helix-turn-helix domain-containing protein [Geminicoccaceae bacterium SCSIO 64248]
MNRPDSRDDAAMLAPRPMRRPRERLSAAEARRVALAAQGFGSRPFAGGAGVRHIQRVLDRLGLLQLDSVNVLVRSHYLPLHARLGAYDRTLLDRMAHGRRRRLFEYWGHEASLLPLACQPLMRWRMADAERGIGIYKGLVAFAAERGDYISRVLDEIADRGPLAASDLENGGSAATGPWWGWSEGKRALEYLFWTGKVTTADRRHFERVYDLTERVIPKAVHEQPTPEPAEAQRALLRIAAQALGVATETDLRDYFRLPVAATRSRLAELVEAGDVTPVEVAGWNRPAYLARNARVPRRIAANALLSPFDSLIWERARTERLFHFRYRLEFYTPAAKRLFGYYVLPFLMGDRLVARVDAKAMRAEDRLAVIAVHAEPGVAHAAVAEALLPELRSLADWLGLAELDLQDDRDLTRALRRQLQEH